MNDKVIQELEKELSLLKNSEDKEKHVYTMKRLLDLLDDSAVENETELEVTEQPTVQRAKIFNQQVEDNAGGNGGDIFDF